MPEDVNTEDLDDLTSEPLIDSDDWELAFKPLEGHAYAALRMGFNIASLRKDLDGLLIKSRPVMEALDLALKVLFPLTDFHKAPFDLFLKFTDSNLTFEEEQMLNALGVNM
jgi:hypothetical protein